MEALRPSDGAGPSTSGPPPEAAPPPAAVRQILAQAAAGTGHFDAQVATPNVAAVEAWADGLAAAVAAAVTALDALVERDLGAAVAKDSALLSAAIGQLPDGRSREALQRKLRRLSTLVPARVFALASRCDPGSKALVLRAPAGADSSEHAHVQLAMEEAIRGLGLGAPACLGPQRDDASLEEAAGGGLVELGEQPGISRLPVSILQSILQHLDLQGRGRAACVGWFWHKAAERLAPGLFHHASRGDAAEVEELLSRPAVRGALAVMHPPNSRTALHAAAEAGHAAVVTLLLEAGADVEAGTLAGQTPLTAACTAGRAEVVRRLMDAGAKVVAASALWRASRRGHLAVVEVLIEKGVLNRRTAYIGYRAMIVAHDCEAAYGAVSAALRAGGAKVRRADVPLKKWAVLVPPAAAGDRAEVARLLRLGADLNARTTGGNTAIMVAARAGLVDIARLLAQAGANLEGALWLAAAGGHYEVADLLVTSAMEGRHSLYELGESMRDEFHEAHDVADRNRHYSIARLLDEYVREDEEDEEGRGWTSSGSGFSEASY